METVIKPVEKGDQKLEMIGREVRRNLGDATTSLFHEVNQKMPKILKPGEDDLITREKSSSGLRGLIIQKNESFLENIDLLLSTVAPKAIQRLENDVEHYLREYIKIINNYRHEIVRAPDNIYGVRSAHNRFSLAADELFEDVRKVAFKQQRD